VVTTKSLLDLLGGFQKRIGSHTKVATIFLMTTLILSVATIGLTAYNQKANAQLDSDLDLCETYGVSCPEESASPSPEPSDLCETYGVSCPEESASPSPEPSDKFFLATFLQYVDKDSQTEIYKPNMGSEDRTRLRHSVDRGLQPEYVEDSLSLPGPAGVSFTTSKQVIDNAKRVKDLGFRFIEFNLEPGLSSDSDNNDVVGAMKRAAEAAHQQGLEFLAAPSRVYTTDYGPQIAPFVDYYHIQAQALQDEGVDEYSDYVHTTISKLKNANPDLIITVQVSTRGDNAPGLSLLETLKQCTDSVMDTADGVSLWYGGDDLDTLESFVEWYNEKY
jgi:hypothetical protein